MMLFMHPEAADLIAALQLQPHPEGGFFRETFRAPFRVKNEAGLDRSASTAIYFLLPAGTFSAFHRVSSDEAWHHYRGAPLDLHVLSPAGAAQVVELSPTRPQFVVPAGWWQAAKPRGETYALCGCAVSPGFEFADFEMPNRAHLSALFPDHAELFRSLCRE
jgi:hypothetical protein